MWVYTCTSVTCVGDILLVVLLVVYCACVVYISCVNGQNVHTHAKSRKVDLSRPAAVIDASMRSVRISEAMADVPVCAA